ncbi:MAG TPA: DUF2520 domain-containing protein [Pyrinomonadaceae bacterium]|nr:DUF2520 domain-containing protein [Pyrinomonadaceae bacterium]
MKISIIGIGRIGGALAIALAEKGFEIENLIVRKPEDAEKIVVFIEPKPKILNQNELAEISSDVIFITTQDSEIEAVAENLAENLKIKPFVFHTSGSRSSESLEKLKKIGCPTGSIHPLVSVSDAVAGAGSFADVFFCVEGDDEAVLTGRKIVEKLGGNPFSIDAKYKILYHVAAVTACGHLVALIDVALEMLRKCGLDEASGREILLPLVSSAIENLERQPTARALTGTFARADIDTLRRQIAVLSENVSIEALEVYLQLGRRSLHLAETPDADAEKIAEMQKIIELAKKNFKC